MTIKKDSIYSIYEKYKFLMFGIAMEILHDKFAAEDAVQNAFIKIMSNLEQIDDLESRRTKRLIITITKHAAIDIYRKRSIQWQRETEIDTLLKSEESNYFVSEEREEFRAIDVLPENYKEVILLKYSAGFSNVEIADILGISEVNVRKRISRAKRQLERNMQNEEGGQQYEK